MGIYNETEWENLPSTNTPVNADNLNKIENALGILSGGYIYESGTNANGNYIKFSNGVALCWLRRNIRVVATQTSGSLYQGTVALGATPITFTDANYRIWCQMADMMTLSAYVSDRTTTDFGTWHFVRTTSTGSSGYGGYVDVFAIGQWDNTGISI